MVDQFKVHLSEGHLGIQQTWLGSALHPRGGVHRVPKDGELGQLCPNEPRNHRPGVHPDTDTSGLAIMRHHDGLGTAEEGL